MAGSKTKQVRQKETPKGRRVEQKEHPERYYDCSPSWKFHRCDAESWSFTQENIDDLIWTEIIPYFQNLEKQTWNEIFVQAKKQNHSLEVKSLNKRAQDRLAEMQIEPPSIQSLRLTGTHRLYGYITNGAFIILWYDSNHGDNDDCVCRSRKKHT